jgi:hypothetical protein
MSDLVIRTGVAALEEPDSDIPFHGVSTPLDPCV